VPHSGQKPKINPGNHMPQSGITVPRVGFFLAPL
jgi:hypothetical protein